MGFVVLLGFHPIFSHFPYPVEKRLTSIGHTL
jgi:hypothetical protein